jgi:hypothetical protein
MSLGKQKQWRMKMINAQKLNEIIEQAQAVVAGQNNGSFGCGFAWVNVKGLRGKITEAFKQAGFQRNEYEGGYQLWVSGFDQCANSKYAMARIVADKLQAEGFKAYAGCRAD